MSSEMLKIVNVVVKSSINVSLNLTKITSKLCNAIYNPGKFSGLIWKHNKIGGCLLLFKTGNLVCLGSDSLHLAKKRVRQYARIIQKLGHVTRLSPIKLVTATGLANCHNIIPKLDNVTKYIPNSEYYPELFSALTFRRHNMHFALFTSGKVVVTGIKHLPPKSDILDPILTELAIV